MKCQLTVQEVFDRGCWEAVCKILRWGPIPFSQWSVESAKGSLTFTEAEARECGLIGRQEVNQELLEACKYVQTNWHGASDPARRLLDTVIAKAEAHAREPNLTGSEVTIETVRAAGRSLGVEPNWKEAHDQLYRLIQKHLSQQETFMEKLVEVARAQGRFEGAMAMAQGPSDDPPTDP